MKLGTASLYYSLQRANGDTFKADAFVSRSLFDLYSNFTFYLNDPVQRRRLPAARFPPPARRQRAVHARPQRLGRATAVLVAGGNFHDNQINVGLYPRDGRTRPASRRAPTLTSPMARATSRRVSACCAAACCSAPGSASTSSATPSPDRESASAGKLAGEGQRRLHAHRAAFR